VRSPQLMRRPLGTTKGTFSCVLWTILTLAAVDDGFAQTTRPVDCSVGETIAAAMAAARPGDTLAVRGLCKETVIIPAEATRITLDGQGVATIHHPTGTTSPGPAAHVVYIRGRAITVSGFRILGGVDGIHLSGPGARRPSWQRHCRQQRSWRSCGQGQRRTDLR
jgi:hypothetical protein